METPETNPHPEAIATDPRQELNEAGYQTLSHSDFEREGERVRYVAAGSPLMALRGFYLSKLPVTTSGVTQSLIKS